MRPFIQERFYVENILDQIFSDEENIQYGLCSLTNLKYLEDYFTGRV